MHIGEHTHITGGLLCDRKNVQTKKIDQQLPREKSISQHRESVRGVPQSVTETVIKFVHGFWDLRSKEESNRERTSTVLLMRHHIRIYAPQSVRKVDYNFAYRPGYADAHTARWNRLSRPQELWFSFGDPRHSVLLSLLPVYICDMQR